MSRIEELIQQLCPDGVEFKPLGEVCNFLNGKGHEKSIVVFGKYIVVNSKFISTDGEVKKYSDTQISPISKDDILMVMSDLPNGKALAKTFIVDENDRYTLNQRICALTVKNSNELNPRFYYYILNRNKQLLQFDNGADQTNLRKDDILKILIPIPPLEIQNEIVKTLDLFTKLEAELEAELEARKTQYSFYRDALLSFEGKHVEWKTLGEVSKILRGTAITKKGTVEGEFPVVANGPTPIYFHNKNNRGGETVVIARSGAYCGLVTYWNRPLFLTDAFSIHPDQTLLKTKFIYFFLKKDQDKIHLLKKGSGVPHVQAKEFESYSIPIPPLHEQERIVNILDKFDALVNDISIGLPAEIEARRKQYEYYRNQLLTFKNINNG
jgi:type I restriction enzyme, S subunit